MKKVGGWIKRIDDLKLEWLGVPVVFFVSAPILYLYLRDGAGSGIFPVHDQLDETILSYVFGARYFGSPIYEQMMCGISSAGLKPSAPLFIPLYGLLGVYYAFLVQYISVAATAFFGMYFFLKKLTKSSIAALIPATLFAFLPFHSIYGNIVSGTPLLLLCLLEAGNEKRSRRILSYAGVFYYAATSHLVLTGWIALGLASLCLLRDICRREHIKEGMLSFAVLFVTYLLINFDIFLGAFSGDSFISHRVEFASNLDGKPSFGQALFGILFDPKYTYDVDAGYTVILLGALITFGVAVLARIEKKVLCQLMITAGSFLLVSLIYALNSTRGFAELIRHLPGMFGTFQFNRVYYFLPGICYILLGIVIKAFLVLFERKETLLSIGALVAAILGFVILNETIRDHDSIFYMNINQINNGEAVTGYMTMRSLYSDELMADIEEAIGKDMSSYRVAHIGISPVAALMHGFYTIDGYSNNYALEYKHKFREIIAGELDHNDFNRAYFDDWGSRCYLFYHEWGNAYMLGKDFSGTISEMYFDMKAMKDLGCGYIFSAAEIEDPESYTLKPLGYYSNEESYWGIYVYEIL